MKLLAIRLRQQAAKSLVNPSPPPEGEGIGLLPLQGGGWEGDGVNIGTMINGTLIIFISLESLFELFLLRVIHLVIPGTGRLNLRLNTGRDVMLLGFGNLLRLLVRVFHVVMTVALTNPGIQLVGIDLEWR